MDGGIVNQFDGCCWLFNTEIMKKALQIMQCFCCRLRTDSVFPW